LAQFLDDASIDDAIDYDRSLELPPRYGVEYRAFVDASAGRADHFCIGIGHAEKFEGRERIVADVIRGRAPPFDPNKVAKDFAELARGYRCRKIVGDNYAGEWVAGAFRTAGASYEQSDMAKAGLYLEMLPRFMQGSVSIPNHSRLVRELRMLERRVHRSGRDTVDHPQNGSDDYANVLAGVVRLVGKDGKRRRGAEMQSIVVEGVSSWNPLTGTYPPAHTSPVTDRRER